MKIWLDSVSGASADPLRIASAWFADAPWLAADPAEADAVVLFSDGYVSASCWQRERRRFGRARCLLYSGADVPNLMVRGFYPSVYRASSGRMPYPYFTAYHPQPDPVRVRPVAERARLVGFRGRVSTHPVRERLQALLGGDVVCAGSLFTMPLHATSGHCPYCDELADTVLSLCPRGFGTSSYRLYESMAWGCVPVIISDDFLPPSGPDDWSRFTIRVPEDALDTLPGLLDAAGPRLQEMSLEARAAWVRHFSPEALKARFPEDVIAVLRTPEISRHEQTRMLGERYHVSAWLKSLWMRGA